MCIAGHILDLEGYKARYDRGSRQFLWYNPQGTYVFNPMEVAANLIGVEGATACRAMKIDEFPTNGLFYRFDLKTPKEAANVIEDLIKKEQTKHAQ
jgi:hypothetical protein